MNERNTVNDGLAVQTPQVGALATMAANYGVDPKKLLDTLKETIAPKATTAQLQAFCIVANEYGLNPFTREIYAFPSSGGGVVPLVGIDGWLTLINRHPQFDGMEVEMARDGSECTVKIHRKDMKYPTVITEYLAECKRNTPPWNSAPRRMLRHKAIIQAARVAFGFSGIYEDKEDAMANEEAMRDVTPVRSRLGVVKKAAAVEEPEEKKEEKKKVAEKKEEAVDREVLEGQRREAYEWLYKSVCKGRGELWNGMIDVMRAIGFPVPGMDAPYEDNCKFALAVQEDEEAIQALRDSGYELPLI